MTRLFEQAIGIARRLPPERQDEIARLVLMLACEDDQDCAITTDGALPFATAALPLESADDETPGRHRRT